MELCLRGTGTVSLNLIRSNGDLADGRCHKFRPRLSRDAVFARTAGRSLPHARWVAEEGARARGVLAGDRALRAFAPGRGCAAEIRAARRPALRQRPHPYRPRRKQDPERHRRPHQADDGLRLRLRAGLGLSRPADRVEGRGGFPQGGRKKQDVPAVEFRTRLPRLRR